jgi:hypothetical protein
MIFTQHKLKKVQDVITTLDTELTQLKNQKKESDRLIGKYAKFVHKRELFIKHDLIGLGDLITEFDGHVKNVYRGQKYQEVTFAVGNVKNRTLEIINKEKRDYDEQLYNIQSDQGN